MLYLWIKSFHIIAMVTWFAGLFYLPRLFVYHAQAQDKIGQERFKVMERKLFWVITTPGGVITTLTGLSLIYLSPIWLKQPWMHVKLTLILLLWFYHLQCAKHLYDFQMDRNKFSSIYFRWFNELPTVILVGAIILVVVKPAF